MSYDRDGTLIVSLNTELDNQSESQHKGINFTYKLHLHAKSCLNQDCPEPLAFQGKSHSHLAPRHLVTSWAIAWCLAHNVTGISGFSLTKLAKF